MKNLLSLSIFIMVATIAMSQSADTLFISKLANSEWAVNYSNSTQFKYVMFEDGSVLGVGDQMLIGKPSGSNQTMNQQTGVLSSSNPTLTNNFTYLMLGRMGAALLGGATYLPEGFKGRDVAIENIKIFKSRQEGKPSVACLIFDNPGMDITALDVKLAIKFGELINPKAAITSDEALAELKRAKEKLELDLITQQQYDSLKSVLIKYIK